MSPFVWAAAMLLGSSSKSSSSFRWSFPGKVRVRARSTMTIDTVPGVVGDPGGKPGLAAIGGMDGNGDGDGGGGGSLGKGGGQGKGGGGLTGDGEGGGIRGGGEGGGIGIQPGGG